MAEQILSQEEIDSLLGAMDKGEIDLGFDKKDEPQIESYDLTSQSKKLQDQFQALDEIYIKFASILCRSLTSTLQKNIRVEFVSSEMVQFDEFISAFSSPTDFTIFSMEPLIGSGLFAMEGSLVFPLIDCMFGGEGKPLETLRNDFTSIEMRMMRRFALEVLDSLEKAWEFVYPLKLSFRKIETKADFIHLVSPNDIVIIVVFSLQGKEFSGNIQLCLSYLMLEPIKAQLSSRYLREKDRESTWTSEIKSLLNEAQITISGELGRSVRNVQEILNLKKDDIISLNTGPQDPVTIKIENIPKYHGFPGVYKGNSSVQITKHIVPHGGV